MVSQGTAMVAGIAALASLGLILRPFRWPEAVWSVLAAAALAALGLIPVAGVVAGIAAGWDVYLFLIGMMLLSEIARQQGLFHWLAAVATGWARGSPRRLFGLVYATGILVTVFLSNDATAVVLTPAVCAACMAARVRDPLPYLLICAFIANAASFVLPISNPANLVMFGHDGLPPLAAWIALFGLPSLAAIAVTFAMLYWTQRRALMAERLARDVPIPPLSRGGRGAAWGLGLTALMLVAASAMGLALGLPTALAGLAMLVLAGGAQRGAVLRGVSWSVLPLVAGLFVIVEAMLATGLIADLGGLLAGAQAQSPLWAGMIAGTGSGLASNVVNNLPAGLVMANVAQIAEAPPRIAGAILIGIDLGPNLSVTGSLATILWLTALRREGIHVSGWQFLRLGAVVMPPALLAALAVVMLV